MFDSVSATYKETYNNSLFLQVGSHHKEEVYYVLSSTKKTIELIEKCLNGSDAIWHSLCLLSNFKLSKHEDFTITKSELIDFSKRAQFIFIGAYDEEGYLIWKKHPYQ